MAKVLAHINPDMLRWARVRAGVDPLAVAHATKVSLEQYERWESGAVVPTFRQAQNAADALHAPFGFFFLPKAPGETQVIPDLRTIAGAPVERLSLNLQETIQHTLQRQAWFIEYQKEQGAQSLSFVGKFLSDAPTQAVVSDMQSVLNVKAAGRSQTWADYQAGLIRAAEAAGILVMRSGIVGNNPHRKLDVSEFRGFAISHPLAPVVFINSADAPAARLFTLIHELAHIWLGCSGISNALPENRKQVERSCNAIAGEFLAPTTMFIQMWESASQNLTARVSELAAYFYISPMVVMRRAFDLGLIGRETYQLFYVQELERFRSIKRDGGSFYRNTGSKNSSRFAKAVIAEALSGRLLLRDAGKLLGIHPSKLRTFAQQLEP
jgi:Zn-dependent peptidase ImmA (M78 family)/transcriptional regulator with XRE-family HTH domain